jgi:glycosyltransferase involved in cell wall biosynthesis
MALPHYCAYVKAARKYMRFSIIIANYNYARFVGQAIESALAIDWRNKEIIVVDDGSTDDSRAVIASFGDRIVPIFVANSGQTQAANLGFARSTGDVVIYLDSDDLLLPTVARQVIAAWREGVAKVQYGMIYVDEALRPLGLQWPIFSEKHTSELASRLLRQTGTYVASPTSAFSRDFLKEVFPLPTVDQGLYAIDAYLNLLAPFFGDVVSLRSPQYLYRRHAKNKSGFVTMQQYLETYPLLICQLDTMLRLANELLGRKGIAERIPARNEYYAKLALVSKRFFPSRYPDRLKTLLVRYWQAVFDWVLLSRRQKALLLAWSLAVAATPRWMSSWVVLSRDRHARAHFKSAGHPRRRRAAAGGYL